jgi:hypothetical protein
MYFCKLLVLPLGVGAICFFGSIRSLGDIKDHRVRECFTDEQERDVWRMARSIQFESKGDGDFFDEALVHAYRFIFLNRETLH